MTKLKNNSLILFLSFFFTIVSFDSHAEKWQLSDDSAANNTIEKLGTKAPKDLLTEIVKDHVQVLILKSGRNMPPNSFAWGKVQAPQGNLTEATQIKALMGKTICQGEHRLAEAKDTIVIADDAPKSTLIHEYLHILQIRKDREWCTLSKQLWQRPATEDETRQQLDREWDVLKVLWVNLSKINPGIEDEITIAHELIEQGRRRSSFDTQALPFIEKQKVPAFLQKKMSEYEKQFSRDQTNADEELPSWVAPTFEVCTEKKSEHECSSAIENLVVSEQLWGDVNKNFQIGNKAWNDKKLKFKMTNTKEKEGSFTILFENDRPTPQLEISMAYSLPEMLITLNHEMVHYANSQNLLKDLEHRHKMVNSCITKYQLNVLKDENHAFISETRFWDQAPAWFKQLFAGVQFNSIFTGENKVSFADYYRSLTETLAKKPNYGSMRYIEIGQYPRCAQKLID